MRDSQRETCPRTETLNVHGGVPFVRVRNQGFGKTGSTLRRVSGDCSTTTSTRKKKHQNWCKKARRTAHTSSGHSRSCRTQTHNIPCIQKRPHPFPARPSHTFGKLLAPATLTAIKGEQKLEQTICEPKLLHSRTASKHSNAFTRSVTRLFRSSSHGPIQV